MGHDDEEIGDIYSKLKEDVEFRQDWTTRIGLGFEIPSKKAPTGPNGPRVEVRAVEEGAHIRFREVMQPPAFARSGVPRNPGSVR